MMAKPMNFRIALFKDPVFNNMEYANCLLYFLGIHVRLMARMYTEKIRDSWHISWYTTRKLCKLVYI